ncbi:MAG: DUF4421 domain-containing protein [Prevotella sp.]|nr:DUF4421 domain-containing protein [Prevotella sp.]
MMGLSVAARGNEVLPSDTVLPTKADTVIAYVPVPKDSTWFDKLYEFVKEFSRIDHNYIERQKYNFTFMIQNTNTYESYWMRDANGHSIRLSPGPSYKVGPYVGWRWFFFGYTIDIIHPFDAKKRQDFSFSLYSNQVGIDLFYRKTGNEYKIKSFFLSDEIDTQKMRNVDFDGFNASIKGVNVYYIFNHKKFSYPAAFAQSTCQRRDAASFLLGLSYTKHNLTLDVNKLEKVIDERLGDDLDGHFDTSLNVAKVSYTDISASAGWAYNWVFAKDWLAAASLSAALGFKRSTGDKNYQRFSLRDFSFNNLNIDGIGRFGLVWNNTKYYAGMSLIMHTYNYSKSQFSTNSTFGSLNFYTGFNF